MLLQYSLIIKIEMVNFFFFVTQVFKVYVAAYLTNKIIIVYDRLTLNGFFTFLNS